MNNNNAKNARADMKDALLAVGFAAMNRRILVPMSILLFTYICRCGSAPYGWQAHSDDLFFWFGKCWCCKLDIFARVDFEALLHDVSR
mmetsp:Transcript_26710/g.56427  ORF Transcript_26710/g.56427 Transcript_26710/m.56427 type:complete len:88 (-) Transcript_26710:92-355(-)